VAPELVIFDCDGVLVDSERLANGVLAALLTDIGLPTTVDESIARYMGRSMPACVDLIEARLGRPVPVGFVDDYYARVFDAFERDLRPVPGVVDALDALRAGDGAPVATCVASSGSHERIRRSLGRTGLLDRFEGSLFSAEDVDRPKPFPDLFLHAAARMGEPPAACAVVEDSPAGVAAGVAAGMRVFGYADLVRAADLEAAGAVVFTDMTQLPALLKGQLGGQLRGQLRGR
jgi:HAD superfamily hydrolase (TIGR01509 family)